MPNMTSPSVAKVTVSLATALLLASVTVAVALAVDLPSAGTDDGLRLTVTLATGPAVSVRVAEPDWCVVAASAVMSSWSAVLEAVIVVAYVPSPLLATGPNVTSPSVEKETVSVVTRLPAASVTVAVAWEVAFPSATMDDGVKVTPTVAAGPAVSVRDWWAEGPLATAAPAGSLVAVA